MRIHSMIAATAVLAVAALSGTHVATAATATAAVAATPAASVNIPPWAHYLASLPPYEPSGRVSGTVTSWGHGFLKEMMRDWERDFRRYQPNVRFQDDLASSAAAMAGLYTGRANLGVLAREIVPMEVAAYQKMTGQKIFPVTVLTGSYADPDKLMALGIFVNRRNPLARLDFQQLDAIFGAQHLAGAPANIRTWGQLALGGAWKDRPIHPYAGPAGDEAPPFYFSQTVMRGSTLWNGRLRQLDDITRADGSHIDGYQRAVDAVATDPDGISVTVAGYHNPQAKLIAVAITDAGPYVEPTRASVADRTYPLSRSVTFYINDGPKIPPDPAVVEFLRYVLSRDGQEQALREGDFLPLTPQLARAQLAKLMEPAPQRVAASGRPALRLVRKIPVPQMTGTWDHLTVDPATDRLFLSAQDQQMVYVVPLKGRGAIGRITAGFDRPQGELYVPGVDRLVITNGRSARVSLIDGHDLRPAAALTISAGADMIASDPAHGVLYVESGGTDSHRGPGWLAVIDPRSGRLTGRVTTGYRAAALVMAQHSHRLYVAIPALDQVAVIDTDTRSIVERWQVPGRPASMALDEASGRLFVATRTFAGDPRPPVLSVLDTQDGRTLTTLPSKDATENMYWDAPRRLIYTSSLDGYVQAYRQRDPNHYDLVATVPTVPHAGTSQLVPGLDELCVATPPEAGQPAAVWVFRPADAVMRWRAGLTIDCRTAPASACGSIAATFALELDMPKPPSPGFPAFRPWRLMLAAALLAATPPVLLAAPPAIGRPAPSLIVPQLDGHEFDLARLRGKVVLVNVWATWCSPCRVEMPTLNAFYRRYHSRGLVLLGLSIDEAPDTAQVRQVMRQFSYPGALASAARVNGFGEPVAVPITYVIDAQGVIRAQLQAEGPSGVSKQALQEAVLPLLAARKEH